jgi:FkbM family methyltransferase
MFTHLAAALKALLPGRTRELLWRLRHLPRGDALTLMATVKLRHWLRASQGFYGVVPGVPGTVDLSIRGYGRPLRLRTGTSDFAVFSQVFLHRQYALLPVSSPRFIIDAGANIGLTSLFFLLKYPTARVVAIEPDASNLAVARQNLRPFASRCTLVHGALWSHRTKLSIVPNSAHWDIQVRPADGPSERHVEGYTIQDIMKQFGIRHIDILKMDIEGAEAEVFRHPVPSVMSAVTCCVAELHGPECVNAFNAAISPYGFRYVRRGELTIAARPSARRSCGALSW